MKWRKLSDCQWAAAYGDSTFRVVVVIGGFESHCFRPVINGVRVVRLGMYESLAKAKRRCEAERIMG